MPYPNEHACRLADPKAVKVVGSMTRAHEGKEYRVLVGKRAGSAKSEEQAYRYSKDTWTAAAAAAHCKAHGGSFEAASGQAQEMEEYLDPELNALIKTGEEKKP